MPRYSQEVSTAFRELSWQPARPIIGSRQPSHGHPLSGVAECTECSHVNHSCLSSGKLEALGQWQQQKETFQYAEFPEALHALRQSSQTSLWWPLRGFALLKGKVGGCFTAVAVSYIQALRRRKTGSPQLRKRKAALIKNSHEVSSTPSLQSMSQWVWGKAGNSPALQPSNPPF